MQSVLDNLCRCFGADGEGGDGNPSSSAGTPLESLCAPDSLALRNTSSSSKSNSNGSVPSTPNMKRRTRSLALQDKQWDALFRNPNNSSSRKSKKHTSSAARTPSGRKSSDSSLSHAHAVAKAKLAASAQRPTAKRKRQRAEDIFRSRQYSSSNRRTAGTTTHGTQPNPLSRFLSNHPVLAHSLCFATPIDEGSDNDVGTNKNPFLKRDNSLISDGAHTAGDDTVSSTVYYERTKLAGLQQTNPPMPLFPHFQVVKGDEIHRIVESRSHSSQRQRPDWKRALQEMEEQEEQDDDDNVPPPMTHSSSESTRSSNAAARMDDGEEQEMEY